MSPAFTWLVRIYTMSQKNSLYFNDCFVANFLPSLSVEEFWKSVNTWRRYGQRFRATFFLKTCIALHRISELRSVTCHMGSHSVTCHPTHVSAPRLNPSHAGRYSIFFPRRDRRLSLPCYSETQPPGVELATSRSRIQRTNHWATKQHTDPLLTHFMYVCIYVCSFNLCYILYVNSAFGLLNQMSHWLIAWLFG